MPELDVVETSTDAATDDATTVEVTVTPPETAEPEADVVVVEAPETGNPATEAVLVEAAIDDAAALAQLSAGLALVIEHQRQQDERIAAVEMEVRFARETADAAESVAVEAVTEPAPAETAPQESPEADSEPDREHSFFRPLFGGKR